MRLNEHPQLSAGNLVQSLYSLFNTIARELNKLIGHEFQATFDPPSLADGAGTTKTITAPGAVLGDYVFPTFSLDLQGIVLTGWVSASDVVSVRFQNESGGTLDLASGTLNVRVCHAAVAATVEIPAQAANFSVVSNSMYIPVLLSDD